MNQAPTKDTNLIIDGMLTLIAILRALNIGYHHAHVNVSGGNYYGDHLLLQRLYQEISSIDEIDGLMERLKGLFPTQSVRMGDVLDLIDQEYEIISGIDAVGDNKQKFQALLRLEMRLQSVLTKVIQALEDGSIIGNGTDGTVNLLQGIADSHQTAVYLIQQRIQ